MNTPHIFGQLCEPGADWPELSEWSKRIKARWQAAVDAILDVGGLLIDAKAALAHGQFAGLFEGEEALPFSQNTANRLMAIARDARLSNSAHGQNLPPSWRTLYELTKLDDSTFDRAISSGIIHADMRRKDAAVLVVSSRRQIGLRSSGGASPLHWLFDNEPELGEEPLEREESDSEKEESIASFPSKVVTAQ